MDEASCLFMTPTQQGMFLLSASQIYGIPVFHPWVSPHVGPQVYRNY